MVGKMGFTVQGDDGMEIRPDAVLLKTSMGGVNMTDLYAYVLGKRSLGTQAVFSATSTGVAFRVPQWSGDVPLRVDPVVYGTYVGGTEDDHITTIRMFNGQVIVAGWTSGIEFPKQLGAYQEDLKGNLEAFVAKFSADLSEVLAYSYFGGGADEVTTGMDVSLMGKVVITGTTESDDLPTGVGAIGQLYKADRDGFVAKFSNDLLLLEAASYIGGNKNDIPRAVAFGIDETVFLVGETNSHANFPVTLAHQFQLGGGYDAFIARFSANLGSFVFCTYYGGTGNDVMTAIYVDDAGDFLVTGSTGSSDFETSPDSRRRRWFSSSDKPYDNTYNGGDKDAFLIRMYGDGTISKRRDENTFATFFGGAGDEEGVGVYVDNVGRPVVVGWTTSTELQAVGTQQVAKAGGKDLFMAILTDDGRALSSCTYFGGLADDVPLGMIPSADNNAGVIYGTTNSVDFPVEGIGAAADRQGPMDGFLLVMNPFATRYSTVIPGNGTDAIVSAALDAKNDVYFVMDSDSRNLPVTSTAWQSEPAGGRESYVGKFAYGVLSLATPSRGAIWCIGAPASIAWSGLDMLPGEMYTVEISPDDGETWSPLVGNTDRQNLNVTVPNTLEPGGAYRLRISTSRGHVAESENFIVAAPPALTSMTESQVSCRGENVVLRAEASGTNVSYKWTLNGKIIQGAVADSLVIESLDETKAGSYAITITGTCKPVIESSPVTVTMALPTSITQQPVSTSVKTGEEIALSVIASGDALTYQWTRNGAEINGATNANLVIAKATMADAGTYECVVTGTCGTVTSGTATVEVENTVSVDEDESVDLALKVLGPIPASSDVRIQLSSPTAGLALIRIVDGQGAVAATLDARMIDAGRTEIEIPVGTLASGSYGLEIQVSGRTLRTMLLIAR